MVDRVDGLARASVIKLAEAEVPVRDAGAPATRLGKSQSLAVVDLAGLAVEP
jgi:hypothetical protein